MIIKSIRFALPVAAALLATAANAGITYSASITPTLQFGAGNSLIVDYTITTDGALGVLNISQITGWTVKFNYNGNIELLSGTAAVDESFGSSNTLLATPTELKFDFTRGPGVGSQFELGTGSRFIFFTARGNEIIGPANTAQITTFYINPSVNALAGGFNLPGSGYQLIGTAAVPEPASWAMLIAGFGLTGAAMRRRARVAATA